jgi:hypothetical protein
MNLVKDVLDVLEPSFRDHPAVEALIEEESLIHLSDPPCDPENNPYRGAIDSLIELSARLVELYR